MIFISRILLPPPPSSFTVTHHYRVGDTYFPPLNDEYLGVKNGEINSIEGVNDVALQKQMKNGTNSKLTTTPQNIARTVHTPAHRYPLRDRKAIRAKGIISPHDIAKKGTGAAVVKTFSGVGKPTSNNSTNISYTPPPIPLPLMVPTTANSMTRNAYLSEDSSLGMNIGGEIPFRMFSDLVEDNVLHVNSKLAGKRPRLSLGILPNNAVKAIKVVEKVSIIRNVEFKTIPRYQGEIHETIRSKVRLSTLITRYGSLKRSINNNDASMRKRYQKLANSDPSMLLPPAVNSTTDVVVRYQLNMNIVNWPSKDDTWCTKLITIILEDNSALRENLDLEVIPKLPLLISDSFLPSIMDEKEVTNTVVVCSEQLDYLPSMATSLENIRVIHTPKRNDIQPKYNRGNDGFSTITTPLSSGSICHYISHLKYPIHKYLPRKKKPCKTLNTQKFLTCGCLYSHGSRAFLDGIYFMGDAHILIPLVCIGALNDEVDLQQLISSPLCPKTYSDLLFEIWLTCDFNVYPGYKFSKLSNMCSFESSLLIIKKTKRKLCPKLLFFRRRDIVSKTLSAMSGSEETNLSLILGQEDEEMTSKSASQSVEKMDMEEKGLPILAQEFLLKDSPLKDDGYFPGTVLSQAPPSDRVISHSYQQEDRDLEFPSIFKPPSNAFAGSALLSRKGA